MTASMRPLRPTHGVRNLDPAGTAPSVPACDAGFPRLEVSGRAVRAAGSVRSSRTLARHEHLKTLRANLTQRGPPAHQVRKSPDRVSPAQEQPLSIAHPTA